ncbi:MAG: hypothetical protein IKV00_05800 [Clostridia bacterium]|nr:hypothetical protein [Clostridia bacterium]
MGFDKMITARVDGCELEYGIVFGNEKIVFVKCGVDGSIRGESEEYLQMAHRLHGRLGATVICASNPCECETGSADKAAISWVVKKLKLSDYKVYLFGVGDGSYQNLKLAGQIPQTVKILGANTSSNTVDRLKERLCGLSHIDKIFVYGTKDTEYKRIPSLRRANIDRLEIRTIEGATHKFSGMLDQYVALTDLL